MYVVESLCVAMVDINGADEGQKGDSLNRVRPCYVSTAIYIIYIGVVSFEACMITMI